MSNLEILLLSGLTINVWAFLRLYRKHLIVRHLFIHSSDWCAQKIEEVAENATNQIALMEMQNAMLEGRQISDQQARDCVNFSVLNAKKDWQAHRDDFQTRLKRNGIKPLSYGDLDNLIWSPGLTGLKP